MAGKGHVCDEEGCGFVFTSKTNLAIHKRFALEHASMKTHHGADDEDSLHTREDSHPYNIDGFDQAYGQNDALARHQKSAFRIYMRHLSMD